MQTRGPFFSKLLFFVGTLLILIQQLPIYKESHYAQLRTSIYIVFGLLCVLSVPKVFIRPGRAGLVNIFALFIFGISIEFAALYLLKKDPQFGDLLEIMVPFGLVVSSYSIAFTRNGLEAISKVYSLLVLVIAIVQVFYYAGGFLIYEQYMVTDKNILGSFVAVAAGIAFFYALNYFDMGKTPNSVLWISVFSLLISVLVTIRSRAALIAIVLYVFVMTAKSRRILRKVIMVVSLVAVASLLASGLLHTAVESIRESIVLGYDYADVDSLSGGRYSVYLEAIEIIKGNPLFGEIGISEKSSRIPHNYLLNKVEGYGILGGLLFVSLYGYLVAFIIRNIRPLKEVTFWGLPVFLLIIPFAISLLEYQHPYGPGTSQALVYFLLGQYLLARFRTDSRSANKVNQGLVHWRGKGILRPAIPSARMSG